MSETRVVAFSCRMCGECCRGEGGIVMDAGDRRRLAAFLNITETALLQRYAERRHGKYLIRSDETGCVFLAENGCAVHPGRPNVCRAWPFFRGNLVDADSWEMAKEGCPGIATGASHADFVEQGRAYLRENGLLDCQDEETGRALWPEELSRPPAGESEG